MITEFSPIHIEGILLICGFAVAAAGAVADMRTRKIPNWLTYGSLLAAFAVRLAVSGWPGLKLGLLGMMVGAAILIVFFLLGGMGGGDVKLMAAVGAWVGGGRILEILAAAAVSGAVIGVGVVLVRRRGLQTVFNVVELFRHHMTSGLKRHPDLNIQESSALRIPFGPAIAIGTLYVLIQSLFWR